MKKLLHRKTVWLSLASSLVLLLFLLMAGGSIVKHLLSQYFLPDMSREELEDGRIRETHEYRDSYICEERVWYYRLTGYYDAHMRWHGLLRIEKIIEDHGSEKKVYTEEVMMVHGRRDGLATTVHQDGRTTYKVYNMGHEVEDLGGAYKDALTVSAFSLLNSQYSWQQEMFNEVGYEDLFLEAYLDTFEALLNTYDFEIASFDTIYGEVDDRLDNSRFDTLTRINTNYFSFVNGMELLKEAVFRMAVMDQYLEEKNTLFEVFVDTYPGYLAHMETEGVRTDDFEKFSLVFDSCMHSYGSLDTADPAKFIDSLDTRIYRALTGIYNTGQFKSASALFRHPQHVRSFMTSHLRKFNATVSTPAEVARFILYDLFGIYIEGNIFRQCIRKAWSIKQGLILLPTLTTSQGVPLSSTGVEMTGFVWDDGGAPVSSRGIVWAEHYDPTLQDNPEPAGAGTGTFSVEIEGLDEEKTYYARSFATNLSGTSYGNCMAFSASAAVGVEQAPSHPLTWELYPNPASDVLWLRPPGPLSGQASICIVQMNGSEVYRLPVSACDQNSVGIRIDLASMGQGTYICQLQEQGRVIASSTFTIIK